MAICDRSLIKICSYFVLLCLFIDACQSALTSYNNENNTLQMHYGAGIPDCPLRQFRCKSGDCIQLKWTCDGESDCKDSSDEDPVLCAVRPCNNTEFRCDDGHCIIKEFVCDKEKDCKDGSDESESVCENWERCETGQFQCHPGMCIPIEWLCDDKLDCPNGLDEKNCNTTCSSDLFTCGSSGRCISPKFVCDGEHDCDDGSDEANCKQKTCDSNDFLCTKENQCIPKAWICDGYEDCDLGEDEVNCQHSDKYFKTKCQDQEWPCKDNSQCIHTSWLCDGDTDCPDASDESPAICANLTCKHNEFQCKNRQCISGNKQCDGNPDCLDSSDEDDCDRPKQSCDKEKQFDCDDGMCIDKSKVCDGNFDCPMREDEPADLCFKNECKVNNGGCSHECVDDKIGFHCACPIGYNLADNQTCQDINECTDPGACSHTCINTIGSFKCQCNDGYYLHPINRTYCKALHGSGSLIFTKRQEIQRISLDQREITSILEDSKAAAAMDFVYKTDQIFWIETANHTIFKAPIEAGFAKTIVIGDNIGESDGLAVDWVYDHIYWTDTGKNTIEVANFDGTMRKTLIDKNLDEPRSIAVNPLEGWMFWSDWGLSARIERAGMDGSHRTVIISHNIQWPNGITLDLVRHRIYWVDAKLSLLSSANYDGAERRTILRSTEHLHLPHSLTIFEDTVYWADWDKQTIFKANKFDGSNVEPVIHGKMVHNPMVIHVFHPYKQPQGINYCLADVEDRCSHLCFPAPQINARSPKIACSCPDGMKLDDLLTTCVQDSPITIRPSIKRPQNAVNIEETVVDIQVEQGDDTGFIAIIFVAVASVVVFFCAVLMYVIYRHYIHKNVTSMNFENFVYKKTTTTDDQYGNKPFSLSSSQRLYSPPSPSRSNDDSRTPLNTSNNSTATELV